jgi:CRP-like cAMP-binding protein
MARNELTQGLRRDERDERPATTGVPAANSLLRALLSVNVGLQLANLEMVRLRFNDPLYEHGDEIEYLYFPIDCVLSSLAIMEDGTTIEIYMTGKNEVSGLAAILGGGEARHWTRCTVAGTAARVSAKTLNQLFSRNNGAQKALLRAYRGLITQVSQRVVCNARHTVLERLCCWLIMLHDRVGDQNLRLTQETIASRVGARRAGITVAAHMLQSAGGIAYYRGEIHIASREILENAACECYSVLESEFADLQSGFGDLRQLK